MTFPPFLIQAVPWSPERAAQAISLAEMTGGTVVWDEERHGFPTYQKVLAQAGDGPVIIIEDDTQLATNFEALASAVIDMHGDKVINFFAPRYAKGGLRHGSNFLHTICHYYPAGMAAELLEFSKTWDWQREGYPRADHDMLIRSWLVKSGRNFWLHLPSLSQHLPFVSVTDTERPTNRQAPTFPG